MHEGRDRQIQRWTERERKRWRERQRDENGGGDRKILNIGVIIKRQDEDCDKNVHINWRYRPRGRKGG